MLDRKHDVDYAKQILTEFVTNRPKLSDAQVMLGELLFQNGLEGEFLLWHDNLPTEVDRHPGIWLLRGRWAHRRGNTQGAVRCLWESIKRFPEDRAAHFLLAKLLVTLGRDDDALPFQQRAELLLEFDEELIHGHGTPKSVVRLISTLEKLQRRWEAIGWCHVLARLEPGSPFAHQTLERLTIQLDANSPLTPDTANPAIQEKRGKTQGKTCSDVACGIYLKLGKLQSKARTTLVPGGGVNVDGDGNSVSWQATPENFLFHHSTLIRVYMAKLADHLRA